MIQIVLQGIWPALVVALAALVPSYRLWRRDRAEAGCDWGVALAVGGGFLAGGLGAAGIPDRWPLEKWEWLFVAVAALTGASLLLALRSLRPWRWLMGAGATMLAVLLLTPPGTGHLWEAGDAVDWVWKLLTAATVGLVWLATEPLARKRRGASLPLSLLLAVSGGSMVLMLSGNDVLARTLGAAAAALGVCVLVAWLRPAFALTGGATAILALTLVGLLSLGRSYSYSEVPLLAYALPAFAPMLLWIAELPALKKLRPWQVVLVRLALVSIPAGLAVALAASHVQTDLYL
jgi:hypothetical protein